MRPLRENKSEFRFHRNGIRLRSDVGAAGLIGRRLFAASRKFAAFLFVFIDRGINSRSARPNLATIGNEETMTKRLARPGLTGLSGFVALVGLALGGCSSIMNMPGSAVDESASAASPANLASLTDVLNKNPSDPQAYNMRGSVLGQSGRYQEALTDFEKAIALDPNYSQAYANRGLAYRQLGQLDLALADYNRALDIDSAYAAAYVGRGMVRRDKGQLHEALQDFNKAIQIRPDNAQAYFNRGLLYQGQRQFQYAIDDFSTAIGLSQQQAEPFVERGLSYLAVNDLKAAAGDFDDAVQIEPNNYRAWTSRGLVYERNNEREKAAGCYARALSVKRDYQPAEEGFKRVGGDPTKTYKDYN